MNRKACYVIGTAPLLALLLASFTDAQAFWPYALAARGGIVGAYGMMLWRRRQSRAMRTRDAFVSAAVAGGIAAFWCCVPVGGNAVMPYLLVLGHGLLAALVGGGLMAVSFHCLTLRRGVM